MTTFKKIHLLLLGIAQQHLMNASALHAPTHCRVGFVTGPRNTRQRAAETIDSDSNRRINDAGH